MSVLLHGLRTFLGLKPGDSKVIREHYDLYVNRVLAGRYFPQGHELTASPLEQRLELTSLLPDFVQISGNCIDIFSSDGRTAEAIRSYLHVHCSLD